MSNEASAQGGGSTVNVSTGGDGGGSPNWRLIAGFAATLFAGVAGGGGAATYTGVTEIDTMVNEVHRDLDRIRAELKIHDLKPHHDKAGEEIDAIKKDMLAVRLTACALAQALANTVPDGPQTFAAALRSCEVPR